MYLCITFLFLCQMASVRPYCRDILQSSVVNHHKPWFQQEDQTGNFLSTTGSLGITNTYTKPAPSIIMQYFKKNPKFYNVYAARCSTIIFVHFKTPARKPQRGSAILELSNLRYLNTGVFARHWPKHTLNIVIFPTQL